MWKKNAVLLIFISIINSSINCLINIINDSVSTINDSITTFIDSVTIIHDDNRLHYKVITQRYIVPSSSYRYLQING